MNLDCINFSGCKDTGGYGLKRVGSKLYKAHRVAWITAYGVIPEGLFVCHKCDNPACVNVDHLFLGNNSDNMKDMYSKGRGNTKDIIAKKLTSKIAEEIRCSVGLYKDIAAKYGVDRTMVGKIKSGVCW